MSRPRDINCPPIAGNVGFTQFLTHEYILLSRWAMTGFEQLDSLSSNKSDLAPPLSGRGLVDCDWVAGAFRFRFTRTEL